MSRKRHVICAVALIIVTIAPVVSASTTPVTISFAVAGDHGANSDTAASLKKLDASGVDFYLAIGDLDYKEVPSPTAWCDYVKALTPTLGPNFPFQLLPGNHEENTIQEHAACLPDRLNSTLRTADSYPTEYYFDYPLGAPLVRVVMISPALVINNVAYTYSAGSSRYNWVADAIDDARNKGVPWVVVGMHKHCFIAGSSSCEIGADLMNMLVQKKVDLVLQGHKHTYQRGKQLAMRSGCSSPVGSYDADCVIDDGTDNTYTKGRGTIVLINGMFGKGGSSSAGGYFVRAGSGDGFTKFTMTADRIDATLVNATTTFTDSYSIVPNQAPTITNPGNQHHGEEQAVTLPIIADDPEDDPMTFSAMGLPPDLTINPATGVISGSVAMGAKASSPYSVRVTASDTSGFSATAEFLWTVSDLTPPATPPVLTITRHTTGVLLDWPEGTEVDLAGYDVSRSASATGTYTKLNASLLTTSEYFDGSAPADATSYYRVTAVDLVGNVSAPRSGSAHRSKIILISQSTGGGSGIMVPIARPDGAQPGDVLLAAFSARRGVAMLPPIGWSLVSSVSHAVSQVHQTIFSHTVAAGDPSTYAFTSLGTGPAAGVIVAYRGAIERPSRAAGQVNPVSQLITAPATTPPVADSVQVGFFGIATDATISPPAFMMERGEHSAMSDSFGVAIEAADVVVDALPLGSRIAIASVPAENMGQVVILSPAP